LSDDATVVLSADNQVDVTLAASDGTSANVSYGVNITISEDLNNANTSELTITGATGADAITAATITITAEQSDLLLDAADTDVTLLGSVDAVLDNDAAAVDVASLDASDYTGDITASIGAITASTGSGADTLTITAVAAEIDAGAGNDTISAAAINVTGTIAGGAGTDTLVTADGGDDAIDLSGATISGIEILEIGTSDTVTVDESLVNGEAVTINRTTNGSEGTLALANVTSSLDLSSLSFADADTTVTVNATTGNGLDGALGASASLAITGSSVADTITTGSGADTVIGGSGADVIVSGAGADVVQGGAGADVINSGAGADTVSGGAGADIIANNGGADSVTGGDGNDTFLLVTGGSMTITDFASGEDLIEIVESNSTAKTTTSNGLVTALGTSQIYTALAAADFGISATPATTITNTNLASITTSKVLGGSTGSIGALTNDVFASGASITAVLSGLTFAGAATATGTIEAAGSLAYKLLFLDTSGTDAGLYIMSGAINYAVETSASGVHTVTSVSNTGTATIIVVGDTTIAASDITLI
jgi:Ca2+-binding RTX toxin-like protein